MARPAVLVPAGAVALVALVIALLWALQRSLVYLPDRGPVPPAAAVLPGASDVLLETEDGLELGAWYVPAPAVGAPAVLVASGNGGSRELRAPLARALAEQGLSVLLFDYRGYGGNPGNPSEQGLARDVRAARRFLLEVAGVQADRLLYFGESLGAAVVTELATEHPPAGLVLRSPFEDLASVGSVHYPLLPVRALLRDRYPVAQQVADVDAPTTVVYGTADSIVPPEQSRRVAAAAARLHRLVPIADADHNDLVLVAGDRVVSAVVELADDAGARCSSSTDRCRPGRHADDEHAVARPGRDEPLSLVVRPRVVVVLPRCDVVLHEPVPRPLSEGDERNHRRVRDVRAREVDGRARADLCGRQFPWAGCATRARALPVRTRAKLVAPPRWTATESPASRYVIVT